MVVAALTACSGTASESGLVVRRPPGVAAALADADRHDRAAEEHALIARRQEAADPEQSYTCGDLVYADQITSGGERMSTSWGVPCWNPQQEAAISHRWQAVRERRIARRERAHAVALARAEHEACRGIPARERTHSPFAHTRSIAEVIPHREAGRLRGVRIVFKPVPGMTAAYLRRAIGCNVARYRVLGEPDGYLPDDPTLVRGAEVTVNQLATHVEVVVRTPDEVAAAVALSRARELGPARTATR